ncbi:MAG: hypothetical protein ACXVHC_04955 [Frankiaceae bacterium]
MASDQLVAHQLEYGARVAFRGVASRRRRGCGSFDFGDHLHINASGQAAMGAAVIQALKLGARGKG